jgi:hypothetical protein
MSNVEPTVDTFGSMVGFATRWDSLSAFQCDSGRFMRLKWRKSDEELVIDRERSGVVAYALALGFVCLVVGAGAYGLTREAGAPVALTIVFTLLFLFAGAALLLGSFAATRTSSSKDGVHVFSADVRGVSMTANLGARKQRIPWNSIEEVALAKRFETIDVGETSSFGRAVVVFVTNETFDAWSVPDRINVGASRSGGDRPFLVVPYPEGQEEPLKEALRQFAPEPVRVRAEPFAVFDHRKRADVYSDA